MFLLKLRNVSFPIICFYDFMRKRHFEIVACAYLHDSLNIENYLLQRHSNHSNCLKSLWI